MKRNLMQGLKPLPALEPKKWDGGYKVEWYLPISEKVYNRVINARPNAAPVYIRWQRIADDSILLGSTIFNTQTPDGVWRYYVQEKRWREELHKELYPSHLGRADAAIFRD